MLCILLDYRKETKMNNFRPHIPRTCPANFNFPPPPQPLLLPNCMPQPILPPLPFYMNPIEEREKHMAEFSRRSEMDEAYVGYGGIKDPIPKVSQFFINIDTRSKAVCIEQNSIITYNFALTPIKMVSSVNLIDIDFYNIFDSFTETRKNNYFQIICNSNLKKTIKVPNGYYSNQELIIEINNQLANFNLDNGCNVSIMLLTNNKVKIRENSNPPKPMTIDFTNNTDYKSLGYQLGFRRDVVSNVLEETGNMALDCDPDKYVYVCVNDYNNFLGNPINAVVFAKMVLTNKGSRCRNGGWGIQNTGMQKLFDKIGAFKISLRDYIGNPIEIVSDFCITLQVTLQA